MTIWPHFLGDVFDPTGTTAFIGIGSILDKRYDSYPHKIVFGAGARSSSSVPDITNGGWDIRFVRGPNTAKALGLSDKHWISDPAIIAPIVHPRPRTPSITDQPVVGFIPYFQTDPIYTEMVCNAAGLRHIPVTLSPEQFIYQLAGCTHILTEAMHGAILADAYRIPWIPCRITNHDYEQETHLFKWTDWMMSINITSDFLNLPRPWFKFGESIKDDLKTLIKVRITARIIRKQLALCNWQLSELSILQCRQNQILEELERLKKDLV